MLPSATPPVHIIHIYELVTETCGHKFHGLCWPVDGSHSIIVYGNSKMDCMMKITKTLKGLNNGKS